MTVIGMRRRRFLAGLGAAGAAMTIKGSRAQSAPIRLGFTASLSGPFQSVGVPVRIGAEAARDYINKNGGIDGRKIELVVLDNAANPNQAIAAYRQFASDGIHLVVGPELNGSDLAVISLLQGLQCVANIVLPSDERLSHEFFNRNFFLTAPNGYTRQHAIATVMARRYPDATRWTGAFPDIAGGHVNWAAFVRALNDTYPRIAGKQITTIDPAVSKIGATDYKDQIAKLVGGPAQGFWTNLFGNDGITFYLQGRAFNFGKNFQVLIDYGLDIDLPKTLKHNVLGNMWTSSYWYPGAFPDNPLALDLVAYWKAATGDSHPHAFASQSHAAVMAYAKAIKATGSIEAGTVIAALEGMTFETVSGTAHYRKEDHQIVSHQNMVRWEPIAAEPGWKAAEFVTVDDAGVINPPAPGVKWGN